MLGEKVGINSCLEVKCSGSLTGGLGREGGAVTSSSLTNGFHIEGVWG